MKVVARVYQAVELDIPDIEYDEDEGYTYVENLLNAEKRQVFILETDVDIISPSAQCIESKFYEVEEEDV